MSDLGLGRDGKVLVQKHIPTSTLLQQDLFQCVPYNTSIEAQHQPAEQTNADLDPLQTNDTKTLLLVPYNPR